MPEWQLAQPVAPAAWWLKVAGSQALVLWQAEHCPPKWLAGFWAVLQPAQLVAPAAWWLNVAGFQALVLWQAEHCPL